MKHSIHRGHHRRYRRNVRAILGFALCFGFLSAEARGFEVFPPDPDRCDIVALEVTRSFTADCSWRVTPQVSIGDGEIDVLLELDGDEICLDVLITETFLVSLGRLESGRYTVTIEWSDREEVGEKGTLVVADAECGAAGFLRGDVNSDGLFDVTDAVGLLEFLFLGATVDCRDACDVDASGELDVSDPIRVLSRLFLGADPPPAPFPECGAPETPIADCEKPHCIVNDPDEVWLSRPDGCLQCNPCDAPPLETVVEELVEQGFDILASKIGAIDVCLACDVCPSGRLYQVLVPAEDAARLIERGWIPADGFFGGRP